MQQYWDPEHRLAAQMTSDARAPQPEPDCCVLSGILWDLAAVYRPGDTWSERMPVATVFNGPVVDVIDAIEDAFGSGPGTMELVLLTRGDCANGPVMQRNLDEVVKSLGLSSGYAVVDLDTLPEADIRRGYPTPTLLYAQRDVFGMAVPEAPAEHPT